MNKKSLWKKKKQKKITIRFNFNPSIKDLELHPSHWTWSPFMGKRKCLPNLSIHLQGHGSTHQRHCHLKPNSDHVHIRYLSQQNFFFYCGNILYDDQGDDHLINTSWQLEVAICWIADAADCAEKNSVNELSVKKTYMLCSLHNFSAQRISQIHGGNYNSFAHGQCLRPVGFFLHIRRWK